MPTGCLGFEEMRARLLADMCEVSAMLGLNMVIDLSALNRPPSRWQRFKNLFAGKN
jgi:hypothetical protein